MIWQNPWAWLGAVTLGVPIAVHVLARRRATRMPFPTLRFLQPSSRLSVRRQRLTDYALLALRLAILLAATAALAQPFVMTASRRHDPRATVVRAIVVDTSASMQRMTASGVAAITAARDQARSAAAETPVHRVIEAADLRAAVAGGVAWLAVQPGRRELVVISDFQRGALDAEDIAAIPAGTGIRTVRVPTSPAVTIAMPTVTSLTGDIQATARITAIGTEAEWKTTTRAGTSDASLLVLAGASEQSAAAAAREAAFAGGLPTSPSDRHNAIVYQGAAERDALLARLAPIDRPWMFDAVRTLGHDATISAAARTTHPSAPAAALPHDRGTVITRDADGHPLIVAGAGDIASVHRLIVFSTADAGTVLSASLIAGLVRAVADRVPVSEFEPESIPAEETARWDRVPTEVAPPTGRPGDDSDGRWLWAAALALLGAEFWLRRRPREMPAAEVVHERVA